MRKVFGSRWSHERRSGITVPVAVAIVSAMVLVPVAGAQARTMSTKQITTSKRALDTKVASYWTKARMANAKPVAAAKAGAGNPVVAGDSATGTPGMAGGTAAPDALMGSDSGAAPQIGTTSTGIAPADGAYPGPHTTWDWFGKYFRYPVSTVGKLFFTEPGVGNFVCSAAVTTSGAGLPDDVWTAGHCVHAQGGGSYYTNFSFCPSYNASGPHPIPGCYTAFSVSTTPEWINSGWWSRDYARIVTNTCGTGSAGCTEVGNVTGGLGFSWNQARDQHWMDFGYPSGSPYTGSKLVVTAAEHRYDDNPDAGPDTNSIGSAQTPGFSGGPWILGFKGTIGYINSVNSYYYTSPNQYGIEIQGPYHDGITCSDWKSWTAWTGTC